MKLIVCEKCGEKFYRERSSDGCPKCGAARVHRRLPPPQVDGLMLDVREADASGKSYGYWRIGLLLEKQKAREEQEARRKRLKEEKNGGSS